MHPRRPRKPFSVRQDSLAESCRTLETASRQWDEAIERLKGFVEG